MIEYVRTLEERFKNIPNFPYKPHYIENLKGFENLRMAYYDEGPKDSKEVFLCLHGEPTWTTLAVGPDIPEKVDEITGHLKLL